MSILQFINENILWGTPILILFLAVGIIFSVKTGLVQLSIFSLFKKEKNNTNRENKQGLSPMQTLTAGLATTLGTGNITAVGLAIYFGGAGAIFWMWVSAFIGMATAYAETLLGIKYRTKSADGSFHGTPSNYIEKGLKRKKLAILYGVLCILSSFGMGNMAQSAAASAAMQQSFNTPPVITGIVIALVSGAVILGGMKRLGAVTEKLVPLLSFGYILGCAIVIIVNFDRVGETFSFIISDAFTTKSAGFGIGAGALQWGIKRGVFSNEAGLGSTVAIHAATTLDNPRQQGKWAMLQVFFDTIIMCTLTAFALLLTDAMNTGLEGDKLAVYAFSSAFGDFAGAFVSISIFLFAICTIAGWSAIGLESVFFVFGERRQKIYKIIYVILAFIGAVVAANFIWELSDMFNGFLAIINLTTLLLLHKEIKSMHDNR